MTIQQCRYVLEILKCGSFNEAAKVLFTAQSSLSAAVKALEKELNIKIFERSNSGVYLTSDGAEFVRYASNILEQNDFVLKKYQVGTSCEKLYITTQHYDFVADVFSKMLNSIDGDSYRISLKETHTYDIIKEVENGYCDIGILAIKNTDYDIMNRYLMSKRLEFNFVVKALPHVFVRKGHALSAGGRLTYTDLKNFPFVSYEQGNHGNSFFTEEITDDTNVSKLIEISDRASLMNVLLTTDAYTVGTGIMPSTLNDGKIVSIPIESNAYYNIGYILRAERKCTDLTLRFVKMLKKDMQ